MLSDLFTFLPIGTVLEVLFGRVGSKFKRCTFQISFNEKEKETRQSDFEPAQNCHILAIVHFQLYRREARKKGNICFDGGRGRAQRGLRENGWGFVITQCDTTRV